MIDGVALKPLKVHADDRGYLVETLRVDDPFFTGFAQSSVTLTYPGVIKAFHWHHQQDDYWYVAKGSAQIVLHDLRADSPTFRETNVFYLGDNNRALLFIPRGVAHGYRVLGPEPLLLIYYTTSVYDPKNPDEERIAWDDPGIGFDWRTKNR